MSCIVQSNPISDVTWLTSSNQSTLLNKPVLTILSTNYSTVVVRSTLIVNNLSLTDGGDYLCVANNTVGGVIKTSKRSIVLHVLRKGFHSYFMIRCCALHFNNGTRFGNKRSQYLIVYLILSKIQQTINKTDCVIQCTGLIITK